MWVLSIFISWYYFDAEWDILTCVCVCVCVLGGDKINQKPQQQIRTVCLTDKLCVFVVVVSDLFYKEFSIY